MKVINFKQWQVSDNSVKRKRWISHIQCEIESLIMKRTPPFPIHKNISFLTNVTGWSNKYISTKKNIFLTRGPVYLSSSSSFIYRHEHIKLAVFIHTQNTHTYIKRTHMQISTRINTYQNLVQIYLQQVIKYFDVCFKECFYVH